MQPGFNRGVGTDANPYVAPPVLNCIGDTEP